MILSKYKGFKKLVQEIEAQNLMGYRVLEFTLAGGEEEVYEIEGTDIYRPNDSQNSFFDLSLNQWNLSGDWFRLNMAEWHIVRTFPFYQLHIRNVEPNEKSGYIIVLTNPFHAIQLHEVMKVREV